MAPPESLQVARSRPMLRHRPSRTIQWTISCLISELDIHFQWNPLKVNIKQQRPIWKMAPWIWLAILTIIILPGKWFPLRGSLVHICAMTALRHQLIMVGRQSRLFVGSPGPPEDEFKKKKKTISVTKKCSRPFLDYAWVLRLLDPETVAVNLKSQMEGR